MCVCIYMYMDVRVWMFVYTYVSYSIFYMIVYVLWILTYDQRMVIWSYWYILEYRYIRLLFTQTIANMYGWTAFK